MWYNFQWLNVWSCPELILPLAEVKSRKAERPNIKGGGGTLINRDPPKEGSPEEKESNCFVFAFLLEWFYDK